MSESEMLTPQGYYQSLTRKEKGNFLRMLFQRFGYVPATMSGKLRKNSVSPLRKEEEKKIWKLIELKSRVG
ncbi:MAG: hypothetical protein J5971_01120 [Prevotella sp.]|nr:hypothetical protein [Prevotella sp.]